MLFNCCSDCVRMTQNKCNTFFRGFAPGPPVGLRYSQTPYYILLASVFLTRFTILSTVYPLFPQYTVQHLKKRLPVFHYTSSHKPVIYYIGALWKLEESSEKPLKSVSCKKDGHVMLSYSWSQQPLLQEISKRLWAQGYNVWMDIEQMSGKGLCTIVVLCEFV